MRTINSLPVFRLRLAYLARFAAGYRTPLPAANDAPSMGNDSAKAVIFTVKNYMHVDAPDTGPGLRAGASDTSGFGIENTAWIELNLLALAY